MNHLKPFGWIALCAVLACQAGCVSIPAWFEFKQHEPPRLFIAHYPLVPAIDHSVNIMLYPEVDASTQITGAFATLYQPDSPTQIKPCADIGDDVYQCGFDLDGVEDGSVLRYSAHVEIMDDDGEGRVNGDAQYQFTAIDLDSQSVRRISVRVPVAPRSSLRDTRFALDTVLVRDPSDGAFSAEDWHTGMSDFIYQGLLADPVYRWRSNQLAFYAYTEPAFVSDYYSGRNTRCGQNPWPRFTLLPAVVRDADAIGVLHQRDGSSSGAGDESAGGDFRDCAGRVVANKLLSGATSEMVSFSARSGGATSASLAAHEFGHALFGLSDEYNELTATRITPSKPLASIDASCCCRYPESSPGIVLPDVGLPPTPNNTAAQAELASGPLYCLNETGGLTIATGPQVDASAGSIEFLPNCEQHTDDQYPVQCWSGESYSECASLQGQCVRDAMWLGEAAPETDVVFDNLFETAQACAAAREAVLIHPGVERAADSVMSDCELLCSPDAGSGPCACQEQREFWRIDRNPATSSLTGDLMQAIGSDVDHGGTCARCIETSLCVRWERARGRTAIQTRDYCESPPQDIVATQAAAIGLIAHIARWFRELFGHAKTTR